MPWQTKLLSNAGTSLIARCDREPLNCLNLKYPGFRARLPGSPLPALTICSNEAQMSA